LRIVFLFGVWLNDVWLNDVRHEVPFVLALWHELLLVLPHRRHAPYTKGSRFGHEGEGQVRVWLRVCLKFYLSVHIRLWQAFAQLEFGSISLPATPLAYRPPLQSRVSRI
jgi:hypothetical protein